MGGVSDPTTGQIVWDFKVPLEQQIAHYRAHPPSALQGLRCRPTELLGYRFDGHGEPVNAIFELECPCGSRLFSTTGWVDEDNDIGPPITLVCDECEAEYDVFDEAKHGYDALAGARADHRPVDHPDDFPEPAPYEVIARFEYASDVLGGDELRGREHEAFTWITILVRTPDGPPMVLFDYECA